MTKIKQKTAVVVSAHSADFVWRAGGAIALYASRGWKVKIVCLSFGERGESAKLWKEGGMTMDRVKALRREEALAAAAVLGGEVEFFDCGDYPMNFTPLNLDRLVDIYRALEPQFILTHSLEDPYNFDHPLAAQEYLWEYYTRVALNRGVQAARNSEKKQIKYAEAYQRLFPQVTEDFQ